MRPRTSLASVSIAAAALLGGCGDGDDAETTTTTVVPPASPAKPPPEPVPVESEGLEPSERDAVVAAVNSYIDALNAGDGAAVCELIVPGAVRIEELPRRGAGCVAALDASIGVPPPKGGPAWRRTRIAELKAVSISENRARVTATVTHDFADRKYNSIEEDVIYLDRSGESWLIAKPSGTYYRAVGYPEPPLRALAPP